MKLNDVKEQKALRVAEMRSILSAAESGKRSLTADEQTKFDSIKTQVQSLEADEARCQFMEDAERRMMGGSNTDKSLADLESRISLVDAINVQVEQRQLNGALAEYAAEHERRTGKKAQGVAVPQSLFEKRAAQTTTTAATIAPDDFRADQFIGLLRNAMVVKSLGARVLPNLRGDVVVPRQATSSTAQWIAEGSALTDSGMTFDSVTLKPRHVGAITELSRQLLQQSNPSIEQLVRDDFVQVVGLAVDKAMLHGNGTTAPAGLVSTVVAGTLETLNWENVLELLKTLAMLNVTPNAWLTQPYAEKKLRSTLKTTDLPGYLMENGQMAGLPVAVTNQLDIKTGTPNKGRMILGDFKEMLVGTWGSVDVLANPYAEGPYSRGAVQVRILTTMDMVPRRTEAFMVIEDIAI